MNRRSSNKAETLRSLIRMLVDASEVIIKQWDAEDQPYLPGPVTGQVPSHELFEARRIVLGACDMCADLVQDPLERLCEISLSFLPARALHIVAEARIFDILVEADPSLGMDIQDISHRTGINAGKLLRVLRCLCSLHIFAEVKPNRFANSSTSQAVVGNDPFRNWLILSGGMSYTGSWKLPAILTHSVKTHSYSQRETAFQEAFQSDLTVFEYLQPERAETRRLESQTFSLAMVGLGQLNRASILVDYPFQLLDGTTIVDVGGGVGSMSLELAKKLPSTRFILQDSDHVLQQASTVWSQELPEAVRMGRVQFMSHDFFTAQPVKGAETYLLRYILHAWSDESCVTILKHLKDAMSHRSRILIADHVLHSTVESELLKSAPAPLPANYGVAHMYINMHDLNIMSLMNGMERTPDQWHALAERAGLVIARIWECRSSMCITEMRLSEDYQEGRGSKL